MSESEYVQALTKGKGMPEHIAQELLENMLLLDQPGYYGRESLDDTHKLADDRLTTWEELAINSTKWGAELK